MISIVIPTLQKDLDVLKALLNVLDKDEIVGEIIIIDNSLKGFEHDFKKVRFIIPKENLYVNPSWNLGVKESKFDYIGLFNDDVLVSENFCSRIYPYLTEDKGIFGSLGDSIVCVKTQEFFNPIKAGKIELSPTDCIINGFGVIMIGHRSAFPYIPEEMKVYGGDEYLFKINDDNGKRNYLIYGEEMRHYGSLSSSCSSLNEIKDKDEKYFEDNFNPPKKLSLSDKLFSIKIKGRHFVLHVLGLRFRFRRNLEKSITI